MIMSLNGKNTEVRNIERFRTSHGLILKCQRKRIFLVERKKAGEVK